MCIQGGVFCLHCLDCQCDVQVWKIEAWFPTAIEDLSSLERYIHHLWIGLQLQQKSLSQGLVRSLRLSGMLWQHLDKLFGSRLTLHQNVVCVIFTFYRCSLFWVLIVLSEFCYENNSDEIKFGYLCFLVNALFANTMSLCLN